MTFAAQEIVRLGTPPNPGALLPGQSSGPLAGEVWDPRVDHTTFEPGAALDSMTLTLEPTEVARGAKGTLLCKPPFLLVVSNPSPGTPFAIAIPNDASLLGIPFCVQAASFSPGRIRFTNALDCVVGN